MLVPMSKPKNTYGMIGTQIKQLRTALGLSQRKLAQKAGLHASHISHIESGMLKNPRLDTVLKIADALGVDRGKFFEQAR